MDKAASRIRLLLICFFWGFTALNGVVFQVVTSNLQNTMKKVMIALMMVRTTQVYFCKLH